MPDDAPTDTQPTPTPRIAGILWGSPKSGKTTYCASSPGHKWVINLDPEGWLAIDHRDDKTVWDYSDLEPKGVVDALTTDKITTRINQADIQPGDTVMFDSCTMMYAAGLAVAIAKNVGAGQGFSPSLEAPGMGAYGARTQYLIAAMQRVIRATRRKGAHIWFLAHEDTPTRDKKGDFLYQSILMSENAVNQSSAAISEIWRLTATDNSRELWVRSSSSYKPMGSRMFRMDEGNKFKLKYNIDDPDLEQPMSIASIWQSYLDGGRKKLHLPT